MTTNASRREFMRRASAMATTGVAAPLALNLSAMANASAANATGYKALVCVYLDGGNDHANTLIPYDKATYDTYLKQRPNLLTEQAKLQATVLNGSRGLPSGSTRRYAVAPELNDLAKMFNSDGNLSVLLNIGNLVEPVFKDAVMAGSARVPPRLGSHNDQRSYYQAGLPEGGTTGWGGRMGDMLAADNTKAIFTAIGVDGGGVFLSGDRTVNYQVTSEGAIKISGLAQRSLYGSTAAPGLLETLLTSSSQSLFANEYATVLKRSIATERMLTPVLGNFPNLSAFPNSGLGSKLAMVARLIRARDQLGVKRQVFVVNLGGFDTHSDLKGRHPGLLKELNGALKAFQDELNDMGVANDVTTFTGSEFGRTVNENGDGSDHGWGSMQFIMGGAVQGKTFFGKAPDIGSPTSIANSPDDLGRGRLLPTMAVDQLAYTLGAWMGLGKSDLEDVLPNITNFSADKRAIQLFKTPLTGV